MRHHGREPVGHADAKNKGYRSNRTSQRDRRQGNGSQGAHHHGVRDTRRNVADLSDDDRQGQRNILSPLKVPAHQSSIAS